MVYVQKTWRHLLAVCGADAQRLLAEADARQATDAGGAAAAAVSYVQNGTPAAAAADLHTAHHAEPDSGGDSPKYLRDPLMVVYVQARKNKTAADKTSVQPLLTEPYAGASSSEADKSMPNVPVPELGKEFVDVSPSCLQPTTSTDRGSDYA